MADPATPAPPAPATQVTHPWRATLRTVIAATLASFPLLPTIANQLGLGAIPAVAGILVLVGAITRAMASPLVEDFLHEFVPWLAARPAPGTSSGDIGPPPPLVPSDPG
jgi:hypothetical protein